MGSTSSTAHRLEIRRALYLMPSNKKFISRDKSLKESEESKGAEKITLSDTLRPFLPLDRIDGNASLDGNYLIYPISPYRPYRLYSP